MRSVRVVAQGNGIRAARGRYDSGVCVACVAASTPELALALGGYAAVRFGRPAERLKARLQRNATAGEVASGHARERIQSVESDESPGVRIPRMGSSRVVAFSER